MTGKPSLDSVVAAAIGYVKLKRGGWVEGTDSPDDSLRMAALRMAEMMSQRSRCYAGHVRA